MSDRGTHAWSLDEEASRPFISQALEAGINFFDTANVYSTAPAKRSSGGRSPTWPTATRS